MVSLFSRSFYGFALDAKHRLAVPVEYRRALGDLQGEEAIWMSFSPQGCVTCLPASVGDGALRDVTRSWLEEGDPELAFFRKALLASARIVPPARHGRLVLPPKLVERAGLGRTINWIGDETSFEIWDADQWDGAVGSLPKERMEDRFNRALAQAAAVDVGRGGHSGQGGGGGKADA